MEAMVLTINSALRDHPMHAPEIIMWGTSYGRELMDIIFNTSEVDNGKRV